MINLSQSRFSLAEVHAVPTDPGLWWVKDAAVAIDAPPDEEVDPLPDARWPARAARTGVCGAVSPRVIALPGGGYRLYYTQILPRSGCPAGAKDYGNATTRILSAGSPDGVTWTPEPGVRLSSHEGGAGEFRVVSSEVVPTAGGGQRLRMYYECCLGPQTVQNSIRSALSDDGGLVWTPEPGVRLEAQGRNYAAPRVVFLDDGRCRLYCLERGKGIISAVSEDEGSTFREDPGLRIAQNGPYDQHCAFAPEILRLSGGDYVMYYAGYSSPRRAYILRAESEDGLRWGKRAEPVLAPDGHGWDAVKCSEMCVLHLPHRAGQAPRYRLLYEACDGTAEDQRGVWRIAGATQKGSGL